ncbi:MAG: hypothetical protein ACK5JH_10865 [Anaerocolumna sp.]
MLSISRFLNKTTNANVTEKEKLAVESVIVDKLNLKKSEVEQKVDEKEPAPTFEYCGEQNAAN